MNIFIFYSDDDKRKHYRTHTHTHTQRIAFLSSLYSNSLLNSMSILFKQRPQTASIIKCSTLFWHSFCRLMAIQMVYFFLLLRPNVVYLRMNKPFISDAKRIIDFTTMTRFENVHCGTRKDRHIIHRNISLKFCCLLSLSTVNEQNKQQKFQSTYNLWNSNSNFFFAIRFILDNFFQQTLFQSQISKHTKNVQRKLLLSPKTVAVLNFIQCLKLQQFVFAFRSIVAPHCFAPFRVLISFHFHSLRFFLLNSQSKRVFHYTVTANSSNSTLRCHCSILFVVCLPYWIEFYRLN